MQLKSPINVMNVTNHTKNEKTWSSIKGNILAKGPLNAVNAKKP